MFRFVVLPCFDLGVTIPMYVTLNCSVNPYAMHGYMWTPAGICQKPSLKHFKLSFCALFKYFFNLALHMANSL